MMNLKLLNSQSFEVKRLTASAPGYTELHFTPVEFFGCVYGGVGSADNAALLLLNRTVVYQAIVAQSYGLRSALI